MNWLDTILERDVLPDFLIRLGIRRLLAKRLQEENKGDPEQQHQALMSYIAELRKSPIAIETAAANEQHYEVPARFFQLCLGARLKYSSGYWPEGVADLNTAEEVMLQLVTERARLRDGQKILELGCGWGSLSLWMAEKFPQAQITAVSNSASQKQFIDSQAKARRISNLEIVTCDMNHLKLTQTFDRVVSVEMFEHMRNYQELMKRIAGWLNPGGLLFVHIFTHREYAYPFIARDSSDWMARYFFTGGQMPSDDLLLYFQDDLKIEEHWCVEGTHYQKTAEAWLQNMDTHRNEIFAIMSSVYGQENAVKWWVYWRVFYMACAELWGYRRGQEWWVSHYLFSK